MNTHKNARLTFEGRKLLVQRIAAMGLMPASSAAGISARTAPKWPKRLEEHGNPSLLDRSSSPAKIRTSLDEPLCRRIEQLRRSRTPVRPMATVVGRSFATVCRLLGHLGLSSLRALDPVAPAVRYERQASGELLHIDTKKLGRIVRPSHRVTGDRRDSVDGAGREFAQVDIDDRCRVGFVRIHTDEQKDSAFEFLQAAVTHYAALGVTVKRLITHNGSVYRSQLFAKTCQTLGIKHTFTKPYRPRPMARPSALYRPACQSGPMGLSGPTCAESAAWLPAFLSYYSARSPHSALGQRPPASRLGGDNLLQLGS